LSAAYTNIIDDLRLLEAPQPLPGWAWALMTLAVLGAAGGLLWRRRARATPAARLEPEAAQEDALAELERLRDRIAAGHSRAYAIAVSGIVRRYLERRFGIVAPRRSTEEFLVEASTSARLDAQYRPLLGEFLGACDFLKFARGLASAPELETMHAAAVRFVTETRLAPAAETRGAGQEAAR
jgi:hypothetical protein